MPVVTRRAALAGALSIPLSASLMRDAMAQNVMRVVVPFPPGGSVDAIARLAQQGVQERLGVNIVIENRTGASGSLGAAHVAKAPPDGSTWLFVFDTHAVNPALQPNMPFDSDKDLDPVLLIGTAPNVLAAHPSRLWKNITDVITAAKAKPDGISYGSVGTGSLGHLTMVLLGKRAGVRMTHVPYRGGGPAMNDALAGHTDMIIGSAALVTTQITSGKLRGMVQTGAQRLPSLSETPTAIESGFAGFESYAWWGVFAPAGTPKDKIDAFAAALTAVLRGERLAKQLSETQQINLTLGGPDQLRAFFAEQTKIWGAVVRENGIKAEG